MSGGIDFGAVGLQSGFVIAVLIAAVFLADRLGGSGEGVLARRVIQIAIGVALILTAFSATDAFLTDPERPELDAFSDSSDDARQQRLYEFAETSAERASEAGTIHLGLGMLLLLTGLLTFRRLTVLAPAILLGGVLLLLLGSSPRGGGDFFSSLTGLYGNLVGSDPGSEREILRFVVLSAGTSVLIAFAYLQWDLPPRHPSRESATAEPPSTLGA